MEEPRWTLDELAERVDAALAVGYAGQSNGRVRAVPDRRAPPPPPRLRRASGRPRPQRRWPAVEPGRPRPTGHDGEAPGGRWPRAAWRGFAPGPPPPPGPPP